MISKNYRNTTTARGLFIVLSLTNHYNQNQSYAYNFKLRNNKLLTMKALKFTIVFFITVISLVSLNEAKAQDAAVSFSVFQNTLSPYGKWMNNARFGQVWVYSDPSFRPYATNGQWEYTNYGWSWVSDFDWGWAPFHYGRWEYDPSYGWMWIPGYEWSTAWVSWSQYNGYYGWAPLGYGLSVGVSFGAIPYDRWNFIPGQYMGNRDFYHHCVYPSRENNYFRGAVTINNYYTGREGRFTRGPEPQEVERYTNTRIEERHIDYRDRLVNRTYNSGVHARENNFTQGQNNQPYNNGHSQWNGNMEQRNNTTGTGMVNNQPSTFPGRTVRDGNENSYPHQNNNYNLPEQPVRNIGGYNDVPLHNNNIHGQPANNNTFSPPFRDNSAGQHGFAANRQDGQNNYFSGRNNNFNPRQQQMRQQNYGSDKSRTPPRLAPEMEQHFQQRSMPDNRPQRSFGGEKRGARF